MDLTVAPTATAAKQGAILSVWSAEIAVIRGHAIKENRRRKPNKINAKQIDVKTFLTFE